MRAQLEKILRPDQILTELEDLIPYGFDGTAMLKEKATAVVFPENAKEVASLVRFAITCKTPIGTRGAGTGLSGGSIPVK